MYRPVDVISVSAWGQLVGAVARDAASGYYAFEYAPAWRASGVELAPLQMPLALSTYIFPLLPDTTYKRLPAMLADALPDDFGNALIDAYLAREGVPKTAITALDRLAYMGGRGMGALEFKPGRGPRNIKPTAVEIGDLVTGSRNALSGNLSGDHELEAETEAAIMNLIQVGTSAGGARAKAVIAWNGATGEIRSGQLKAPAGFEYWLLKLDGVGGDSELGTGGHYGRIEYAYYLMATAAGIAMSESRLLEENHRAHFMTRRFDRIDGERVHMQTLCAMTHLDFKQIATHDYAQFFQTIRDLGLPESDLVEGYRRMVFNVLAANCDDHTKNLSFLLKDRHSPWRLAPAYDITHAHNPAGAWTYQHLMSVGGKFGEIRRSDMEQLGERFSIPFKREVYKQVAAALARWPEFAAAAGLPESDAARVQQDFAL